MHGGETQIHLRVHVGRDLVRQHVRDPHEAGAPVAFGEHLRGSAVLLDTLADDGVDQPPLAVVAIDQDLARHRAVRKRDGAGVAVELGVGHEAGHQPRMQRAEIAQRVPDVIGRGVDEDFFVDGSHGESFVVLISRVGKGALAPCPPSNRDC